MAAWLVSGLYTVGSNEQGVVLRFGRIAGRTAPGLHLALPWPIDRVATSKTTAVQRLEVGFRFLGQLPEGMENARRSDMLTGDENILKLMMVVQYEVKNAESYLFRAETPNFLVERAVESAMSAAVAYRTVDDVLTGAKSEIEIEVVEASQKLLDRYDVGITLLGGNLQIVSPPMPVMPAFNDVNAARKDAESQVENARLYANQILPSARAQADSLIQEARGLADMRVNQARGEADRFVSLLAEYWRDKDTTRRRLYLETMERILARTRVVVVPDGSRITIFDRDILP